MRNTIIVFIACIALLLAGYIYGRADADRKWELIAAQQQSVNDKAVALASEAARTNEQQAAVNAAAIDKAYQQGLHDATTKANHIIADLHTGALRLRQSLSCTISAADLSSTNSATSISDAADRCGLSKADAEFLIRFAERADKVATQLKAAQAFIQCEYERGKKRANIAQNRASSEKKGTSDAPTACGGRTTAKSAL